jgi:nitrogen fixation NifU-like protein
MVDEDFDAFVRNLQTNIDADAVRAYGEKGFARLQNPRFHGELKDADAHARLTGKCGDTIEIFLSLNDDCVQHASYLTDGCASSALAGSFTAELAHGKTVEELFDLRDTDVLEAIGTFPEHETHCTFLAVSVLHEAANSYMRRKAAAGKN